MNGVFANTVYFLALANPRDALHTKALKFSQQFAGSLVTSAYVLTEVANFFCRGTGRQAFLALLADLKADPRCQSVSADHDLWERGVLLFQQRADKEWSLTDCISFVVMNDQRLQEAATADRHFEQAEFRILL